MIAPRTNLRALGGAVLACTLASASARAQVPVPADATRPAPVARPAAAPLDPPVAAPPAAAPVRRLPALDHEPLLGVLLARAPRVTVDVQAETTLDAGGLAVRVGPGDVTFELRAGSWALAGAARGTSAPGVLASGGRPIFALDALPQFGAPKRMRLAGDLLVRADGDALEIIERVPMETYLAGVVAAEMNPNWPAAALAAQAIVARSYAAARWMERADEPWQLHWHFGVDMAYHGWSPESVRVGASIASTRGETLMFRGFPVLALFHACSGGRTEAFERVKPGVLAPDGKTPIADAMPIVGDDAALLGAAGLGLSATHGIWKADVPLPDVTSALQKWSAGDGSRPRFGTVEAVSIEQRYPDSGRVASVSIRHRLDGTTRFTTLAAADFRLAVSPVRIRSLWWDRCVIASKSPGYLVLEGRGFGHGCGLSQVSAWYLAGRGEAPEAIVARFYAGAKIERRY